MICFFRAAMDVCWYLSIVMPLFFSVSAPVRILLSAIPAVWSGYLFLNWKNRDFGSGLSETFLFELRFLAFASVFELFMVGLSRWQRECAPFAAAFAALGVLLLRIGRLEEGRRNEGKFLRLNGLYVAAVLAAAVLLASPAVTGAVFGTLGWLYQTLVIPVLVAVFGGLAWVLMELWERFGHLFPELHEVVFESDMVALDTRTGLEGETSAMVDLPFLIDLIGWLLMGLIVFFLLRIIYKRLTSASALRARGIAGVMERTSLFSEDGRTRERRLFGGERNVRYYYRKFLKLCMERNLLDEGPQTTESVHRQARQHWPEESLDTLLELRALYRESRYKGEENEKDAGKRAKALYKDLKDREKTR